MLVIPRGLARSFRALARKCLVSKSRGSAPPVLVTADGQKLTLAAKCGEAFLSVEAPLAEAAECSFLVPMSVFEAVEGAAVTLSTLEKKGTASWEGRDGTRMIPFESPEREDQHLPPARPEALAPVPAEFLTALHECGRTADREEATRFALDCVQVHGETGTVAGTDARHALLWNGFTFPFPEVVLIPAIPVFGTRELGQATEVRVGRTPQHLVVQAGSWTIWLDHTRGGRYPDIQEVIPRFTSATGVRFDDRDAKDLLAALPGLSLSSEEDQAVTLDLDGIVTVRVQGELPDEVREMRLERSSTAGPSLRIALFRRMLARALTLGCLSLRCMSGKPLVAEGPNRVYVVMPLDAASVVPPREATPIEIASPLASESSVSPFEPQRGIPPMNPESNGHGPPILSGPIPNGAEPLDLLAEAEGLRLALADVVSRSNRLIQALKQLKRQRRVLEKPALQCLPCNG